MILQPTLVVLLGNESQHLAALIRRWIKDDQSDAFEFAFVQPGDDLEPVLAPAVERLRSAGVMQRLSNAGYLTAGFAIQTFRTLIVCDANDSEQVEEIRKAIQAILTRVAFGQILNRVFWVVVSGPTAIDAIFEARRKMCEGFGTGESITLFHVLPYWRGATPNRQEIAAIIERLCVLLLKCDADPTSTLANAIAVAGTRAAWVVGIEGYRLTGNRKEVSEILCKRRSPGYGPLVGASSFLFVTLCPDSRKYLAGEDRRQGRAQRVHLEP